MSEQKLGQDPAFPSSTDVVVSQLVRNGQSPEGMSKRFYAACNVEDDIEEYVFPLMQAINTRIAPDKEEKPNEFMKWVAETRAIWRYMQADELLKQEDK